MEEVDKKKEEVEKKTKEAQEQIDNLFSVLKGSTQVDSSLEQSFQILNQFVNSSDKDWIRQSDQEKKDALLNKLRSQTVTNKEFFNRKCLSHSEVISNTSALSGRLLTKNVSDFLESRKAVLQTKIGVNLKSPRLTQTDETREFQSNYQRDQFDKCLSTSGWGTANGITAADRVKGIGAGYAYENQKQNERENVTNRLETFFSRVLCSVTPTALWEPQNSDVSLSKGALLKLYDIEKHMSIERDMAKTECERFFKEYGSHVYLGAIHLGGIYKIETKFESNEIVDMALTKEMVQSKHSESVNASFGILGLFKIGIEHSSHFEEGKAKMTGKFESTDSSIVQTTESKVGGPQEVSTLPLWKLGLFANNSMWVVVDGGKFNREDYTPVWELVQQQSQDFKNPCDLIQLLSETWENLSGMTASKHVLQVCQVQSADDQMQTTIKHMIECSNSENDAGLYANTISELFNQVLEIQKNIGNTNIWKYALKNNNSVSEFLKRLTQQDFSRDQETEVRRFTEKLLALSDNVEFPHRQEIHLWMSKRPTIPASILTEQQVHNIDQFNDLVKKFLNSYRVKHFERNTYAPPDFTLDLETAIASLVNGLLIKNDFDQVLYLYSHLIHLKFDVKEKYFEGTVTIKNLINLSETLEHTIPQYHERKCKGPERLQAWILKELLSGLVQDCLSESSDEYNQQDNALSKCSTVLQSLNGENFISNANIKALTNPQCVRNIEELIDMLSRIVDGKDVQYTKLNILQWKYFEKKPAVIYKNAKDDFIKKAFNSKANNLTDKESRQNIPDLVKSLDLSDYFPSRLTVEKALAISNESEKQSASIKDLPWLMLKQIITGNFKFREKVLEDIEKINIAPETSAQNKFDRNVLDMFDSDSDCETIDDSSSFDLHPLDVLLVLYVCCDPFLKGLVAQKIFSCQFAIPLIHKDYLSEENLVLSLWPLRGIVTTIDHSDESVVTQDTTIISFIRLGERCKISKSKFLNEILRDESETHNTFFHRDCKFGMNKRTVSDGMVEIAWYLPLNDNEQKKAETPTKQIREPLTILNMRGDAVKYRKQTDTVLDMSRIAVVFCEFEYLKNERPTELINLLAAIHGRDIYVILVTNMDKDKKVSKTTMRNYQCITKMNKSKTHLFSTYDLNLKREYNACEMKESLIRVISDELAKEQNSNTLEMATTNVVGVVCCDETNKNCIQGKELAKWIFSSIAEMENHVSRKDTILPLQGECFWRQWSSLQKEKYRSGKSLSDRRRDKIWEEMMNLREAQVKKLNCSPDIMARFIETLIDLIDQNETTMFFLAWLKRFLDTESRTILPSLRKQLHHAFHDYEDKKNDSHMSHVEGCKTDLANASLGLEHFYRELGQIYEAFMYGNVRKRNCLSANTSCLVELLPYLAAKLLILGQPLELMDGDAANVPQRWTDAVFKALYKVIGDKKVVSISVLGIQSSGKSTLLNTMFGLQFSVSAGRCTRGVFLQLLSICGESTRKGPSYALIIDTEGLRAPESSGKAVTYDNELATFVIGLADIIILNIKGETMGEMENVLQIVVHELLRLKQAYDHLSLCQSVILVHQNISAQDAAGHLEQGNLSIVANLNKVTKEAASQACMSGIESFKDVIHFNSKDHVKYVSDLWLGNPPMAPINPRYSSQASEVVGAIFQDLIDNQHQFLSINDTSLHLKYLWDAILEEDFVFSFCNGLQIKAYNLLENEYLDMKWRLEKVKMDWENRNIIPRFKECKNENEIKQCGLQLVDEFKKKMETEKASVLEKMDEFLQHSDNAQQMAEWQESKKQRLKDNADELVRAVQRKIQIEKDHSRSELKQDSDIERRKKLIAEMAKSIAESLQGQKPNDAEKKRHFNDFWRKEIDEIKMEVKDESPQIRKQKIKQEIIHLLDSHYRTDKHLLTKKLNHQPIGTNVTQPLLENSLSGCILEEHISVKGNAIATFVRNQYDKLKGNDPKHLAMAIDTVNLILRDIDKSFKRLLETDVDYDKTQFSTIIKLIKDGIATHNNDDSKKFRFSPALEILVAVQAGNFAFKIFEELSSKYNEKHSIMKKLQAYKPFAWLKFDSILNLKRNEINAAYSICLELKDIVRERIERTLPDVIASEIRTKFGNRKHFLVKKVLEELASKRTCSSLLRYIAKPESYIEEWLENLTNKHVFDTTYYVMLTKGYLTTHITNIKSAANVITNNKQIDDDLSVDIHDWIHSFKVLLRKYYFGVKANAFQQASEFKINNLKDFVSCVQEKLCLVERDLTQEFEQNKPETIIWQGKNPHQAIFESLWGCTAKCPFCKEPCINGDPNHASDTNDVHMCIQHRPSGIGGTRYKETNILLLDSCSHLLYKDSPMLCGHWCNCSKGHECNYVHKLRDYKQYLPEWEILPAPDSESSKYWAWCMVQHSKSLANFYGVKEPEFPESWRSIKKNDALESLNVYS